MRRYRRLMHHCRGKDDEAGTVLVFWAVALVGLMGLTAMAVDLGNVAQTKQHAETAVQDAALAAVPQLAVLFEGSASPGVATAEASAVGVAETYLEDNFTNVQTSDFTDPGKCAGSWPIGITVTTATNCIGFFTPAGESYPDAIAVAMPTRTVNYTFGRAAGLTHQDVSAVAYAVLEQSTGGGGFPFTYSVGGGTGTQCLKSGSGGTQPCQGFTTGSGQFGVIDSPRYRVFPGYSSATGSSNTVIMTDMVLGFDHKLWPSGSGPEGTAQWCDIAVTISSCANFNGAAPKYWDSADWVMPSTGQTLNLLTKPLFTGGFTTWTGNCTLDPMLSHPDGFAPSRICGSDNPWTTNGLTASSCPSSPGSASTPTPVPSDCPDYPFLASTDTFGSSYPDLNGRSIAAYLDSAGQTLNANCIEQLPQPFVNGNPDNAGEAVALDAQTNGTFVWAGYDACLSTDIQTLVNNATTAPYSWYNVPLPASDQIFSASITQSPRFGVVPLIAGSPGSNPEEIVGFADVYLDMVFSSANKVSSIMAWVFPPSMVSNQGSTSSVGGSGYVGGAYDAYLCSYGTPPC